MTKGDDPAEALRRIQQAAVDGDLTFASDTLTAAYDDEIQHIFAVIRQVEGKPPPKRGIWASDRSVIGEVVSASEPTEVTRIVEEVGRRLGITLAAGDLWYEVASRLRDLRGGAHRS